MFSNKLVHVAQASSGEADARPVPVLQSVDRSTIWGSLGIPEAEAAGCTLPGPA